MTRNSWQFAAWIRQKLAEGAPGERLPTDAQMAEMFGLSKSTVRRLLARHAGGDVLSRIPGKGSFLSGPPQPPPVCEPPRTSAENIAAQILDDIHAGVLRRGQVLPPVKQMVYRLRVSAATVRRAYGLLRQRHVVTRTGRTYRIGGFTEVLRPGADRDVMLFGEKPSHIARLFTTDELAPAYRKMELELHANGLVLHVEPLEAIGRLLPLWRRRRQLPQALALWLANLSDFEVHQKTYARIRRLADALGRRPPALLVDGYGPAPPRCPRGIHLISRGNIVTASARMLAEYLVRCGWRAACFFAEHEDPKRVIQWVKARAELKHLDPEFEFRMVARAEGGGREARRSGQALTNVLRTPGTALVLTKYERVPVDVLLGELVILRNFAELYARFPHARMWVFLKDRCAADALHWARDAGVPVPRALSIISTEHDPNYYHLGLSCCMPDYEQIGYQMAHALIGEIPIRRTTKGYIRTEALLMEKETTRRE
ncbi:MAG: GntR family transcriptional regulator [Kiritimatiellae bacterium]|nr:GntR family transcriptional regulator [Kiritimatiellia bacterium]